MMMMVMVCQQVAVQINSKLMMEKRNLNMQIECYVCKTLNYSCFNHSFIIINSWNWGEYKISMHN